MSDKPKCPVFGCTIPRGIPHEHPAGVSAVMRDPAEPLSDRERAELERYRDAMNESIRMQHRAMQGLGEKLWPMPEGVQRDAIVHGTGFSLDGKHVPFADIWISEDHEPQMASQSSEPHHSFVKSVGRIAFWMIICIELFGFIALALFGFSTYARWFS